MPDTSNEQQEPEVEGHGFRKFHSPAEVEGHYGRH
jgi:hypothetical protein